MINLGNLNLNLNTTEINITENPNEANLKQPVNGYITSTATHSKSRFDA